MTTQRILVTGAGGFVGRHLVAALRQRNAHILAVDVAFDADLLDAWRGNQWITPMVTDTLTRPHAPLDAIIHAAAVTTQPDDMIALPETNLRENIEPALRLLEFARNQRVKRVVILSSDAIFSTSAPGAIDEDVDPSPQGTYAIAKATLEMMAVTLRRLYGRNIVAARLSSVYGTGEMTRPSRTHLSRVMQLLNSALTENRMTIDEQAPARSWSLAADVAEALVKLLFTPTLEHALYNVASEECLTEREIATAIQTYMPEVAIAAQPASAPVSSRRGYLSHARLRHATGFDTWTPFATGIGSVIAQQKSVSGRLV